MNKYFAHIQTVLIHKYYVARACWAAGLWKQGIFHDLSKFSPTEFQESVRFYQGHKTPINVAREAMGYSAAWLHHKGHNKHHFEYWVDYTNKGDPFPVQMPFKYAAEALCDMIGASKAYNRKGWQPRMVLDYWNSKQDAMPFMHPHTKWFLTCAIEDFVALDGSYETLQKERLQAYYEITDTFYKGEGQWEQLSFIQKNIPIPSLDFCLGSIL